MPIHSEHSCANVFRFYSRFFYSTEMINLKNIHPIGGGGGGFGGGGGGGFGGGGGGYSGGAPSSQYGAPSG